LGNVATLTLSGRDNAYVAGQTIHVQDLTPSTYNGSFPVLRATASGVSFALPQDSGAFRSGGLVAPTISNRDCVIKDNVLHDTAQTLDVNRTTPGGLENNCLNSVVSGNRAVNLGGPGFLNIASGARYIDNETVNVGFTGKNSAVGDADSGAFVAFDNGSGLSWYRSANLYFKRNTSMITVAEPASAITKNRITSSPAGFATTASLVRWYRWWCEKATDCSRVSHAPVSGAPGPGNAFLRPDRAADNGSLHRFPPRPHPGSSDNIARRRSRREASQNRVVRRSRRRPGP
jgi:hypothetical protein